MSDLECITFYPYIRSMKNQSNNGRKGNGVTRTNRITEAQFIARLDICPMTPKGFEKRAEIMARNIGKVLMWKFADTAEGNRFSAKTAADYVQDAYLSLITPNDEGVVRFDLTTFTYNGKPLFQGEFYRLWKYASIQKCCEGNRKGGTNPDKGITSLTFTDEEGVVVVKSRVEEAMQSEVANNVEINLLKEVRHLFNLATTNADKRFWQTFEKMVEVELSPLPTADACTLKGWENRNAYYVAKKRMLADERLQALRNVRALREVF